ncbi:MAG: branched-chain amino acid aminotransferase [Bacteroides sp. SM23_62_1]|nr:MAG: branched-chain amino acid aminotransferase [Bacteroides sp. SM23_62_1]
MKIDWKNLPFGYMPTDYNVRCYYRGGQWGELEITSSEYIPLHMAATSLHYGQEAFEGMKAYMGQDRKIRIFRWQDNAGRMANSAIGIKMAVVPDELFHKAIITVVNLNKKYIPPYGTGAALYLRPLLIGTGAEVGVKPASEYLFMIFVTPVGPYFKEGFKPMNMLICRSFDRAAPMGTGHIKVGGNYAASLVSLEKGHEQGYASVIYLDAREKKYIDECGPANFFGIKNNTYITPDSSSILPSITNKSLMTLAGDIGIKVEKRPVPVDELASFDEVGACGTAAVISPIGKIFDPDTNITYEYCKDGNPGPVSVNLYNKLTGIQYGDEPDPYGWIEIVD